MRTRSNRDNARPLTLVRDGQPVASIVVADAEAAAPLRFAAEELRRYVREMSGATLPIRARATSAPAIVLASQAPAGRRSSDAAPRIEDDAYSLTTRGARLHLEGASPRAVLFAAYHLVERLGCGFCVPGEDTVPRRGTVTIEPLEVSARPAFALRSHVDHPFQEPYPVEWHLALIDWLAKNRFNVYHPAFNAWGEPAIWYARRGRLVPDIQKRGLFLQVGGHTIHTWLPHADYFDEHPDWYALIAGSGALLTHQHHRVRQAPAACVSHPDVQRAVVRDRLERSIVPWRNGARELDEMRFAPLPGFRKREAVSVAPARTRRAPPGAPANGATTGGVERSRPTNVADSRLRSGGGPTRSGTASSRRG